MLENNKQFIVIIEEAKTVSRAYSYDRKQQKFIVIISEEAKEQKLPHALAFMLENNNNY